MVSLLIKKKTTKSSGSVRKKTTGGIRRIWEDMLETDVYPRMTDAIQILLKGVKDKQKVSQKEGLINYHQVLWHFLESN